MTKTCPDCQATVHSTSQPERVDVPEALTKALNAFSDFINEPPQYEDMRMVRDYRHELAGKWIPVFEAIQAALAATPAVGGEELKDAVRGAIARGWCSRANEHKEFDADLASSIFAEVWAEVAAAPPASPLRGRELAEAGLRYAEGLTAQFAKTDWKPGRAHIEQARNSIKRLAELIIASPPERPAAPAGHEICSCCKRVFKFGDTCTRGGCPCGGDV